MEELQEATGLVTGIGPVHPQALLFLIPLLPLIGAANGAAADRVEQLARQVHRDDQQRRLVEQPEQGVAFARGVQADVAGV